MQRANPRRSGAAQFKLIQKGHIEQSSHVDGAADHLLHSNRC